MRYKKRWTLTIPVLLILIGLTSSVIYEFFSLKEPSVPTYPTENGAQIVLNQFSYPHNASLIFRINTSYYNVESVNKIKIFSWKPGEYTPLSGSITGIVLANPDLYEFYKDAEEEKNKIVKCNVYSETPLVEHIKFVGDSLYFPFDTYDREFSIDMYDQDNKLYKPEFSNFGVISLDRTVSVRVTELKRQKEHHRSQIVLDWSYRDLLS